MICIIPARGGSRRIPRKNIKDFRGRPMLSYAIDAAHSSQIFDYVFVSTDDDEISNVARKCGAQVHRRDAELSVDNVGTQTVMGEVLKDLSNMGVNSPLACCIYPCVPLLDYKDLVNAMDVMVDVQAAYVFSVGTTPSLHDAGQFYMGVTEAFIDNHPLIHPFTSMYPIAAERDCDINTVEDWNTALRKYDALRGIYAN